MTRLQLITRGDDAGSCDSANRAIREACEQGILRNVSVMVPGPAFEAATAMFADMAGISLGLHVTLNAEWDGPKWGPVLPPARVPSLVDNRGYFTSTPSVLHARGVDIEQIMAEVGAQLDRARVHGLNIQYLDEHMGVGWLPGLRERLAVLAQREGLVDAHRFPGLPAESSGEKADKMAAAWIARIAGAAPGAYVLVTHPGHDDEDMRHFYHAGLTPGQVARERDAERGALINPQLRQWLQENDVEVIRYTDAPAPISGR